MSIPKVIHYCWFGNSPKPELALRCIDSWKKYCIDYEIIEWNENNIDISICPDFVKDAYRMKKYAFVTDYIRLKVVYENGGIYLDTDVELLKSLDNLIDCHAYFGCEGAMCVNTGIGFGAEMNCSILKENMDIYESISSVNEKGEFVAKNCPYYTTNLLKQKGVLFPINNTIEPFEGVFIYPNSYFNPYDWKNNSLIVTSETYSIHHYSSSWMMKQQKLSLIQQARLFRIERKYGKLVAKCYDYVFWSMKKNGGQGFVKRVLRRIRDDRSC